MCGTHRRAPTGAGGAGHVCPALLSPHPAQHCAPALAPAATLGRDTSGDKEGATPSPSSLPPPPQGPPASPPPSTHRPCPAGPGGGEGAAGGPGCSPCCPAHFHLPAQPQAGATCFALGSLASAVLAPSPGVGPFSFSFFLLFFIFSIFFSPRWLQNTSRDHTSEGRRERRDRWALRAEERRRGRVLRQGRGAAGGTRARLQSPPLPTS